MDDFDPVVFYRMAHFGSLANDIQGQHVDALNALAAEAYKRGMLRAAEICMGKIPDEILTGKVDHNEIAWSESCTQAIEKEANR